MLRFFRLSAFMVMASLLLYHLGGTSPIAEYGEIQAAFSQQTDISGEHGDALPAEKVLVEVFLAGRYKKSKKELTDEWTSQGVKRVRIQFFKLGDPPKNIAIGGDIPAPLARFAIDWALEKNKGVNYILPEFRFFKHHIAIGSSHYDEDAQIPITAEELEALRDPALGSEDFHRLYRKLTGEDEGNPTYLDSERLQGE